MQIAERVAALVPASIWSCIDIHALPDCLTNQERWKKYRKFDGTYIPFPDGSFDVVVFCDVLHHIQTNVIELLAEASRAGRLIIIKDHFEYSFWSRMILWAMDFVGNWGYGISLPKRYFTRYRFNAITKKAKLNPKLIHLGIDLYPHIPVAKFLLRQKWQFIALLEQNFREQQ